MNKKPLSPAKFGLNKTDKRLINQRLEQLRNELERQAKTALDLDRPRSPITLTRYKNIERGYRLQLTAINLLLTNLNNLKNETNCKSFRSSVAIANGTISKITDRQKAPVSVRPRRSTKRVDRLPIERQRAGFIYSYVSRS